MQSYYHAYQSYERRILRGELGKITPAKFQPSPNVVRLPLTYRLGDRLVRIGLKLKGQARAGHALSSSTMAEK
jgi:hypothetical protein